MTISHRTSGAACNGTAPRRCAQGTGWRAILPTRRWGQRRPDTAFDSPACAGSHSAGRKGQCV
eukprot:4805941-Prymnesium_polylepis.1